MRETPRSAVEVYGVALVATLVCLLVRWPLWPLLGDAVPHMSFFPAVVIAAYYGGVGPRNLAPGLRGILANDFLTNQRRPFPITVATDMFPVVLLLSHSAVA